jgi:hypothetical protein
MRAVHRIADTRTDPNFGRHDGHEHSLGRDGMGDKPSGGKDGVWAD